MEEPPWLRRSHAERLRWYFMNLDKVVEEARRVLDERLGRGRYEVYLFGSLAEDDYTMASDIDLLIVSDEAPRTVHERAEIVAEILRSVGLDAPLEIHITDRRGLEWYRRFARKLVRLYP